MARYFCCATGVRETTVTEEFYRMKRLPPYVIAEVNAMRAAARARGADIIDLGMGNPDLPPPPHVIEKLCEVAMKPDAHGYSASKGIPGVRKAQANYYVRRFNVELDPETEVVMTMGSKEGLASLATAITAPGDVVLVRPGDLIGARPMDPADTGRRTTVLGKYRNGETTSTAKDEQASGAVSTAVQ